MCDRIELVARIYKNHRVLRAMTAGITRCFLRKFNSPRFPESRRKNAVNTLRDPIGSSIGRFFPKIGPATARGRIESLRKPERDPLLSIGGRSQSNLRTTVRSLGRSLVHSSRMKFQRYRSGANELKIASYPLSTAYYGPRL